MALAPTRALGGVVAVICVSLVALAPVTSDDVPALSSIATQPLQRYFCFGALVDVCTGEKELKRNRLLFQSRIYFAVISDSTLMN